MRVWPWGLRRPHNLHDHDAHAFFEALCDSVVTGRTLTNVSHSRAILIGAHAAKRH